MRKVQTYLNVLSACLEVLENAATRNESPSISSICTTCIVCVFMEHALQRPSGYFSIALSPDVIRSATGRARKNHAMNPVIYLQDTAGLGRPRLVNTDYLLGVNPKKEDTHYEKLFLFTKVSLVFSLTLSIGIRKSWPPITSAVALRTTSSIKHIA